MKTVVLTSNLYHALLTPFAYYWQRYSGYQPVTVVCYDAPLPELPVNFSVVRVGKQAEMNWSLGLIEFLNSIDDELILLMLEDYFLDIHVNWKTVETIEELMRFPCIGKVDLTDDRLKLGFRDFGCYNGIHLVSTDEDAPFQTSLQAAIWRKQFLWECLSDGETPWEFEKHGTNRLIRRRQTSSRTPLIFGTREKPLSYANACGGMGNKPGVIERKHMPPAMWQECIEKGWAHG